MFKRRVASTIGLLLLTSVSLAGRAGILTPARPASKPRVLVVAVNGAEWDLLRPLLIRGEMPNLRRVVEKGVYGKLRTLSAPNCPKIFTTFLTGVAPEQNGITGFVVYTINGATGALTSIGTIAAGSSPSSIAVHPSGKFAYVANEGSHNVSMYSIDAATGALTLIGTIGT